MSCYCTFLQTVYVRYYVSKNVNAVNVVISCLFRAWAFVCEYAATHEYCSKMDVEEEEEQRRERD